MSDYEDNVLPFGSSPATPPEVERAPPALSRAERHQIEVRLDVSREQLLLWRVAVVVAGIGGLLLVRQILLGA